MLQNRHKRDKLDSPEGLSSSLFSCTYGAKGPATTLFVTAFRRERRYKVVYGLWPMLRPRSSKTT